MPHSECHYKIFAVTIILHQICAQKLQRFFVIENNIKFEFLKDLDRISFQDMKNDLLLRLIHFSLINSDNQLLETHPAGYEDLTWMTIKYSLHLHKKQQIVHFYQYFLTFMKLVVLTVFFIMFVWMCFVVLYVFCGVVCMGVCCVHLGLNKN